MQERRIAEHIDNCEECTAVFVEVAEWFAQLDDGEDWRESRATISHEAMAHRRSIAAQLVAAAVILILGFALGRTLPFRDAPAGSAVAPRERLASARFTGSTSWAPMASDSSYRGRAGLPPGAIQYLASSELRRTTAGTASAAELRAVGTAQALVGQFDTAIETLTRASAAEPDSAALLSDLGAALLARAEWSDRLRRNEDPGGDLEDHDSDVPAALEAIERALEISPRMPQALFNRALALEGLYLRRSARKAWASYVEVDRGSPWANEARARLAAIAIPVRPDAARLRAEIAAAASGGDRSRLADLVEANRQLARLTVQEELLPGWGEASLAGDHVEATRLLRAAAAVADEWEAQTADPTLRVAVAEIEDATHAFAGQLAAGYRAHGEASRAFAAFDLDAAQSAAVRALAALPPKSPGAAWPALVQLGCMDFRGSDLEAEGRRLARDGSSDPASVGRAHWIVGHWHAKRGNLATALAEYRQSLAAYERLEEVDSAVAVQFVIGEAYGYMGATNASWKYRRVTQERAPILVDSDRALSIAGASAALAFYEGRPRVAADLLDEALAEPNLDRTIQIAALYLWRSRVLLAIGRTAEARQELQRAAVWTAQATPAYRQQLSGDLNLVHGLLEADPRRAVARFSRALTRFREIGAHLRLPGVLLARARAQLRTGDAAAADADLQRGLELLEEQGGAGIAERIQVQRLDGPDQLFDERVALYVRQGLGNEAFAIAEASRGRSLRELAASGRERIGAVDAQLLRPGDLAARLDPETTLLFYSWLPDAVRVWRIGPDGVAFESVPMNPRELSRLVSTLSADLAAGAWTEATRGSAMRLHAALLSPAILSGGPLVIVPDGELHGLPFAALIHPKNGRFLIEEHELVIAPSVDAFLRSRERSRAERTPPAEALVVGDPRLDPLLFPNIRSLPGARQEARQVAALYPRRELLLGGAATHGAFLDALGRKPVVHFSGHAVANRTDPERSSLPLANDATGATRLLVAADIARLDLTGIRTVVLSGCETGVGQDGGGEGPLSLARAFLVAGVPNVVASLWPIGDESSAPLMTAFHRRLRGGERPAAALRAAQLQVVRTSDRSLSNPGVWATFQAFGG